MSTEENEAVVRRFLEQSLGGGGDPEPVDEPLDPDLVRYDPYIEAGEVETSPMRSASDQPMRRVPPM